jgi:hypothetical protein
MGTISYTIPVPGTDLNSVADPEIATALTTLLTLVNGNIDTNNISPIAAITAAQVAAPFALSASVNQGAQKVKGATNIATSESTSSATFTTLTTPDQVTGIVLPTNGLISVWYHATWQESVTNAARADIFLGANEMQVTGTSGPIAQPAVINTGSVNSNYPLTTYGGGLESLTGSPGGAYTGDVTTGQTLGAAGTVDGGPCCIFAVAGTYTVSVQFKASSGTVTASNRKLWVQALSFA